MHQTPNEAASICWRCRSLSQRLLPKSSQRRLLSSKKQLPLAASGLNGGAVRSTRHNLLGLTRTRHDAIGQALLLKDNAFWQGQVSLTDFKPATSKQLAIIDDTSFSNTGRSQSFNTLAIASCSSSSRRLRSRGLKRISLKVIIARRDSQVFPSRPPLLATAQIDNLRSYVLLPSRNAGLKRIDRRNPNGSILSLSRSEVSRHKEAWSRTLDKYKCQKRNFVTNAKSSLANTKETEGYGKSQPSFDANHLRQAGIRERLLRWEQAHNEKQAQLWSNTEIFRNPDPLGSSRAYFGSSMRKTLNHATTDFSPLESESLDAPSLPNSNLEDIDTGTEAPVADLEAGDMVELAADNYPMLAVYIRRLNTQNQFYTMTGRWVHRTIGPKKYLFIVKRFCDPSEFSGFLPYLPKKEIPANLVDMLHTMPLSIPRDTGASLVIDKMNRFSQKTNEIYRAHLPRLQKAHELVADKEKILFKTLREIASIVLETPPDSTISDPALWAVHQAITSGEPSFLPDIFEPERGYLEIISREELGIIRQVKQWVRDYQEHVVLNNSGNKTKDEQGNKISSKLSPPLSEGGTVLGAFLARARVQISNNRTYRLPFFKTGIAEEFPRVPGTIGPQTAGSSSDLSKGVHFSTAHKAGPRTPEEIVIIRFIELWSVREVVSSRHVEYSLGSSILRATGMYDDQGLGNSMGFLFLQEMGVLAPWDSMPRLRTRTMLPDVHWKVEQPRFPDVQHTLSNLNEDRMADLRRDWGDLEVFCVDPKQSLVIDDGFSIEADLDDKSCYWIRVHIANPTAYFASDTPLAHYVASKISSRYLPEMAYNMLPPQISQVWSLDSNRPCLTFSAKMTLDGDIVDHEITPGYIRRIVFVTPDSVQDAMKPPGTEYAPRMKWVLGRPIETDSDATRRPFTTLSEAHKVILRKMQELTTAFRQKRLGWQDSLGFHPIHSSVKASGIVPGQPHVRNYGYAQGDPPITIEGHSFEGAVADDVIAAENSHPRNSLVAEMMVIANYIAGKWCAKRKIPVPFRGSSSNADRLPIESYKRELMETCATQPHPMRFLAFLEYTKSLGRPVISTLPLAQKQLQLSVYVQVTSPLRRYVDMLAHWQIESALRAEAREDKELITFHEDDTRLCFSRKELDNTLPWIEMQARSIREGERLADSCWRAQWLLRAYVYREDPACPRTFQAFVYKEPSEHSMGVGMIRELGMLCGILNNAVATASGGIIKGDWWLVRPETLFVYRGILNMDPLELIERQSIRS